MVVSLGPRGGRIDWAIVSSITGSIGTLLLATCLFQRLSSAALCMTICAAVTTSNVASVVFFSLSVSTSPSVLRPFSLSIMEMEVTLVVRKTIITRPA